MKTEKRLTMALSVLVALMMLAVPLASSSNLFVDGGQTNSNGDAPLLGADAPSKNDYVEIKDVYVINSVDDLKKLPIYESYLKTQTGYTDKDLGNSIPCLITVYTAKDGVVVGNKVANGNMKDGEYHLEFTVNGTTQLVKGYSGLTSGLKDTNGNYYYILPLNSASSDSEKLSIDKAKYYQKYTVTAQLKDKTDADFGTKLSVDSAVDSITIDEVWMIDDKTSFEKIKNDYKKDLEKYIGGGEWTKVGNDERKPWVAVAFTATSPGTYNITFSYTDGGKSVPVSLDRSVSAAGQYVFVATVGNDQDGGTGDKLGITDEKVWGNNTYNVRITSADKVSVGSVTYGNVSSTYDVIFKLNADDKSLDIPVADIPAGVTDKVSWSKNADGDLVASVTISEKDADKVSIEYLLNQLFTDAEIDRDGYTLTEWASDDGNYTHMKYDNANNNRYSTDLCPDGDNAVEKNMTFTATWELMEGSVEVPVHVYQDDVLVGDFIKTYDIKEKNTIFVESTGLTSDIKNATGINTYGIVVNSGNDGKTLDIQEVYSYKITYGSDNDLPTDGKIASNSEITVNYNLNDRIYSKIIVHSEAFKDGKDVTLFALKNKDYTYAQILDALQYPAKNADESKTHGIKAAITLDKAYGVEGFDKDRNVLTSDKYYLLTGWNNGAELLDSSRNAPAELTLDSKLNGYYVIFMVNGQFEVVYVPYGELSADKCTIASGVKYWSYVTYADYKNDNFSKMQTFSFTKSQIKVIEGLENDHKAPVAVFIGSEYSFNNTAYAVFDAGEGNFGNKYVDKMIVSGKASSGTTKTTISLPEVSPVYENTVVLVGYEGYTASGDGASTFKDAKSVQKFTANVVEYEYTITFYNGSDINGIFYYGNVSTMGDKDITPGLVAFSYNGTAYDLDNITDETAKEIMKNFSKVLFPAKDGYKVTQWKDADGNVMLDKVKETTVKISELNITYPWIEYEVKFKKVSSDMSFYANFEAEKFGIVYSGNTATATNNMVQVGSVDEALTLFKDSTFSNDGYKLTGWNTRPDGDGTSYKLGDSFTLNGAQFEDLSSIKGIDNVPADVEYGFTLYAIWEKSGSTPGDNEGNDGNNTDTYLLAGILIVIIILILLIAFLMRRKQ